MNGADGAPASIAHVLAQRAAEQPSGLAYVLLEDGERESARLTLAELDAAARRLAAELSARGLRGATALLVYPSGLDFLVAFFGCLYAGVAAVPVPVPSRHQLGRLCAIAESARPGIALTSPQKLASLRELGADLPGLSGVMWLGCDTEARFGAGASSAAAGAAPDIDADAIAFIQYTSGSTSDPKGVVVRHHNLIANLRALEQAFAHPAGAFFVSWLPLYHDMGLVSLALLGLYTHSPVALLPPLRFLEKPVRWLRAISRYRAHTSGAPNFAFDLCASKIGVEDRAGLDLSAWRQAFNGAEPIHAETLRRFEEVFAPSGFRASAFYPCYGMAEACVFLAGGDAAEAPVVRSFDAAELASGRAVPAASADGSGARSLVSCGRTWQGERLRIVEPETRGVCAPGSVGEIWVSGPSICAEYLGNEVASREAFGARLEGEPGAWLRTGDLGFIREGQLFITGRLKDLIIVRGSNHYPQDIERCIERAVPELVPHGSAAFAVERPGGEGLIVVAEVQRRALRSDLAELCRAIRASIARELELEPERVLLVKPGTIPRTSSGKLQRQLIKRRWLAGEVPSVAEQPPANAQRAGLEPGRDGSRAPDAPEAEALRWMLESGPFADRQRLLAHYLRVRISRISGARVEDVAPDRSLVQHGLSSVHAVALAHELGGLLRREVDVVALLDAAPLEALAARLLEPGAGAGATGAWAEPDVGAPRAMSQGQRAIWAVHERQPGSVAYNLQLLLAITSPLDAGALRRSFEQLVQRHAALRTALAERDGELCQIVRPAGDPPLDFEQLDVAAWDDAHEQAALRSSAEAPFELGSGSLLRVRLASRASDRHQLLIVVHHAALDFWSLVILVHELRQLYAAEAAGSALLLPRLPASYSEFTAWQSRYLSEHGERLWSYWRRELAGELPMLLLPLDRPRPKVATFRGAVATANIDAATRDELDRVGRALGATPFMTALAAFAALLQRYTEQGDMILGAPAAGRPDARFAGVVGYFTNPVALRLRVAGEAPFSELVRQVRATVLAALEHQHYPFSLLVERLRPERDAQLWPLYQVAFTLQVPQLPGEAELGPLALGESALGMDWGGLRVESARLEQHVENFDLKLVLARTSEGLVASFQYNRDLFEPASIERMARHFSELVRGAARDPACAVAELPVSDEAERARVLQQWNETRQAWSDPVVSAGARFAAVARALPDALALEDAGRRLSYAELERVSRRLAKRLLASGLAPEERVGVALPRSADFVIAALAVLRAGGAYVPLDPKYPSARLAWLVADAKIRSVVARRPTSERLPNGVRLELIDELDASSPGAGSQPGRDELEHVARGDHEQRLAYMIYTSGSTGRPKGVELSHGALLNLVRWHQQRHAVQPSTRATQLASPSFDASVWEVWPYLLAGASVHVVPAGLELEPQQLLEWAAARDINLMFVPTALGPALLGARWPASLALDALLTGGDRLRVGALPAWAGQTRLVNHYGPTECAVVTTAGEVDASEGPEPTIGRPIANTEVYLLDRQLRPVPLGAVGELCVAGAGLARGYARQPGLTAQRFVPHPFSTTPGARLYRSGDRARFLPDGRLQFIGRRDAQIKLRGYRVELGEIEAELAALPQVEEASVQAPETGPGERRLAAYVALRPAALAREDAIEAGHVDDWARLYDRTYREPAGAMARDFDIIGWNSSYDGRPLPADEMRRWLEQSVASVLELGPRRVLEVGCGTGLVLSRIAPFCEQYAGTDISAVVLGQLRHRLDPSYAGRVRLEQLPAHALDRLGSPAGGGAGFDTVILNSVVQYFPSAEYLLRVIGQALALLDRDGGQVWIGDVRDLTLLEAFHADVALERAARGADLAALVQRVREASQSESELCVAPELFLALPQRFSNVVAVELRLKPGGYRNELSRFRYDVLLRVGGAASRSPWFAPEWRDGSEWLGAERLVQWLARERPAQLALRGIPDARTRGALQVWAELSALHEEPLRSAGEFRPQPAADIAEVDPGLLWSAGQELGYRVDLLHAAGSGGARGSFDVVFRRQDDATSSWPLALGRRTRARAAGAAKTLRPSSDRLASDPLRARRARSVLDGLEAQLRQRLPEHMVPSAWVIVDRLPRGPSGKVAREALPALPRPAAASAERAETPLEQRLLRVWQDVLGAARLGIDDNFFESGGDSILAIQVASRARDRGIELRAQQLFEHQTVRRLAAAWSAEEAARAVNGEAQRPAALAAAGAPVDWVARVADSFPGVEAAWPMSSLQRGLWHHSSVEPGAPYIEQLQLELAGDCRSEALRAAWRSLILRHPALRSRFVLDGSDPPLQLVMRAEHVDAKLIELDWRDAGGSFTSDAAEQRVAAWLADDAALPFEAARAPLFRLHLIRFDARRQLLVWTHHHSLLDGWSVARLVSELLELYAAALGEPTPERETDDRARGQLELASQRRYQAWLAQTDAGPGERFWRAQLAGWHGPLELSDPELTAASGGSVERFGELRAELAPERVEALTRLAQRQRVSLSSVLHAAWASVLGAFAGRSEVVIGSVVSGRQVDVPGIESLVGLFINTLPVPFRLHPSQRFATWLAEVQTTFAAVLEHGHAALSDIQRWAGAGPQRPLFESVIAFENYPLDAITEGDYGGVKLARATARGRTHYPLTLMLQPGRVLRLALSYDRQRFGAGWVRSLLGAYRALLELLPERSEARLGELGDVMRASSPAPSVPEPLAAPSDIARSFERAVQWQPDAIALVCEERELSYAELNRRANQLAHLLIAAGVRAESRVALRLERSASLVVAVLAVLKAGGAYVPIEPDLPEARAAHLLRDSGARLLIVDGGAGLTAVLAEPSSKCPVLDLSAARASLAAAPSHDPSRSIHPLQLAYIIYTSGSSGEPKGVGISHHQVLRLLSSCQRELELSRADVWSCLHSYAFDFSVWEMFGALLSGARLVLVPHWVARDPEALWQLTCKQRISVLSQTPSAFYPLATHALLPGAAAPSHALRYVVFGGEALNPSRLGAWVERYGDERPRLINMYGITETTVHVTYQRITSHLSRAATSVIGLPLADLSLRVLDVNLHPLPLGVLGELFVGGAGVGRGYAGRPSLTAMRFLPDPFPGAAPGSRLYRSGDVGYERAGAERGFVSCGRRDQQIKLRGHRIELGEIEAQLCRSAGVEAAAVALDVAPGERQRLVAYISGAELDLDRTRRELASRLPEYMLPSAWVVLASLPRTVNGKLDRAALRPPPESERRAEAPEGPIEAALIEIWQRVLQRPSVGRTDDFFALGGDSISSMQVVSQARTLGLDVSARALFEHRSVGELAPHVRALADFQPLIEDVSGPVPLGAIQRWFVRQRLARPQHFNQALLIDVERQLPSSATPQRIETALHELARRHSGLRLRYDVERDEQRVAPIDAASWPLEIHDLSTLASAEQQQAMERFSLAAQRALHVSAGPTCRGVFYRCRPAAADRLLLAVHHWGVDGVSWRILLEELAELLAAERAAPRVLPLGFERWARGVSARVAHGEFAAELAFWTGLPWPRVRALPRAVHSANNEVRDSRAELLSLDARATAQLLGACARHRAELRELLLAALADALLEWMGPGLVRIELEGHGREELVPGLDPSRSVGWFTTLFPFLLELEPATPAARVQTLQRQLRAVPRRGAGFGILSELGAAEARGALAGLPRAQLCFNYLGQFPASWADSSPLLGSAVGLGATIAAENARYFEIDVNLSVVGGELSMHWTFSRHHDRSRIMELAELYRRSLERLWRDADAPSPLAPSDFALAGELDLEDLSRVLAHVDQIDSTELGSSAELNEVEPR